MSLEVDIRHRLGAFSVDATFSADKGVTALFGRSGSGKTSLINIIAGLLRPQSGRLSFNGDVLFDGDKRVFVPAHKRRFGYVFQEARLLPHLSVRHNLGGGLPAAAVVERISAGSSNYSASVPCWIVHRPTCPAAKSSALPSAGHCCPTRACC
jgi:ABC-type molybdate transport system ATPase subunit